MIAQHYVEEPNLSIAWARALQIAAAAKGSEVAPLVVIITGFGPKGDFAETPAVRQVLDDFLDQSHLQPIDTVANTIFPKSLWNPDKEREHLFQRYENLLPRLHKLGSPKGTYFERMISGGPEKHPNQLDFVISTYKSRKRVRRSVLQVSVFDPRRDHSPAALLGFPCLQHVTFAPTRGGLCLNAFYALQYLVERAYGNYVGLCQLGRFVAHELGIPLLRVTCSVGVAQCEKPKGRLKEILGTIKEVVGPLEYIDGSG